ncbi:class I SAM-dependent methyltransferase [Streptomyces sp. HC44]|uniref:Class I SAM-dependent methyltransferase n=1 Tax=Streptomyces scabichelini TaxID=2711217 RepID=A0A6G4VHN5_9ACTN|nr:class I SAM-dependent methyltransferase [Streptomyces scabichelini]NGO13320.1 class I SAM-dependent methyltransferase [Streptomyces scabichelini]
MAGDDEALLAEQMAYYRARAPEYDRVYAERSDLRELLAAVDDLPVTGDVLELACGTGQWTGPLAARARSVTALDAAAETLDIACSRVTSPNVLFTQADVFTWRPSRRYDTVFFAFWLSHVPPSRMADFWNTVGAALAPQGRAIFIDDGPGEAVHEEVLARQPVPAVLRPLDDGSRHRIVKVFHDAETLTGDLAALGWSADVRLVDGSFIVGVAEPSGLL